MQANTQTALKKLIYRMADDQLIIGHRNSEWVGLGPFLEEDIAFSSIAQDKVGHSFNLYSILRNELGEQEPDTIGFTRNERDFTCCQLVELPNGEYDFSLIRHFLFDSAELLRFEGLSTSTYEPLARVARKYFGEIKYHVFHATTWVKQLAMDGNEVSKARMQSALNEAFPYALGIFEAGEDDQLLVAEGIFEGEDSLKARWMELIAGQLESWGLSVPTDAKPVFGGRKGYHSDFLQPLLDEMGEVFRLDPTVVW